MTGMGQILQDGRDNDQTLWPQRSTRLTHVLGVCTAGVYCLCEVQMQGGFLFFTAVSTLQSR